MPGNTANFGAESGLNGNVYFRGGSVFVSKGGSILVSGKGSGENPKSFDCPSGFFMPDQDDQQNQPCDCAGFRPKYDLVHATIIGDAVGEIAILILWRWRGCEKLQLERLCVDGQTLPLRIEPPRD